jgi:hypothetical protein
LLRFESAASNLVAGDTNAVADVFVADRDTGIITRASVTVDEQRLQLAPGLSGDGRHLVFWSKASNLVRRDRNGRFLGFDVFVRSVQ